MSEQRGIAVAESGTSWARTEENNSARGRITTQSTRTKGDSDVQKIRYYGVTAITIIRARNGQTARAGDDDGRPARSPRR